MPENVEASKPESKREDEEEEISLPVPDFDEDEYKEKEVEKGKLAVMNTGYGLFLASVAVVVQPMMGLSWKSGWVVLGIGVLALRGVYRLGGVTSHEWGLKEWLGAYVTLFFSFLAGWYLFSNPPFV